MRVLILGYGEMGHAMAYILNKRHDVCIWQRSGDVILEDEAAKAQVVLFCLPVNAHREITGRIASSLGNKSICLSIAKGLDESGRTAVQIFDSVLTGTHRFGVIYGPMISEEIMLGRFAFADVALSDPADFYQIRELFLGSNLVCEQTDDMQGICWSVILKNVYAIMFGISDELGLGDNMRGYLMAEALSELSAIVKLFGAESGTPYGYAGLGDLLTTATSENSHHYELGRKLATGDYGVIAGEGINTLRMVEKYQLFDYRGFLLFALLQSVVANPPALKNKLDIYLSNLRNW
jgi:glycerol-3-phosphate dehydrogenase (NAD(P)+)